MEALSEDLSLVLRLTDNDFWELVKTDNSLLTSLESFLRFRRRGFDEVAESSLIARSLEQRVLLVFLRFATVPEKANTSTRQKQANMIYDYWIIDVPRILDLCTLYKDQSPSILQELLRRVLNLQPRYLNDLKEMVSALVQNLTVFEDRCTEALTLVQDGNERGLVGWNDVFSYILDICVNLSAFVEFSSLGARQLMHSRGLLLSTFAQFHDMFLPRFDRVLRNAKIDNNNAQNNELDDLLRLKCIVMTALQKTAFLLLKCAFLSGDGNKPHIAGENGESLMNVIMSCAIDDGVGSTGQLISKANDHFQLFDLIIHSIDEGRIALDDAQFDYLTMLFSSSRRPDCLKPVSKIGPTLQHPNQSNDVQKATLLSKVNQIKDILPEYGDGFLERCLTEYNQDPEKVENHTVFVFLD